MDLIRPEEVIRPQWPAPARVRSLMTTRAFGDLSAPEARARLRGLLPSDPAWLRQVHGTAVVDAGAASGVSSADASVSRSPGAVCAVMAADCMPVLLADAAGSVVAAAHAGWRGLCAGVIESAFAALRAPAAQTLAWLGPAIGPKAYEVGEEVRAAFLRADPLAERAFLPSPGGRWLLDLYEVARQRLAALGVTRVYGGGFCTYTESERFFSYRRSRTSERMAAFVWLS